MSPTPLMNYFAFTFVLLFFSAIQSATFFLQNTDALAAGRSRVPPEQNPAPPLIPSGVSVQPSDDPDAYSIDPNIHYTPQLSELKWVVPSASLPSIVQNDPANNNCSIIFHEGRLFLAWRTAPTHFASKKTQLHIVSSQGRLYFKFFEGGTNPLAFEPSAILVANYTSPFDMQNATWIQGQLFQFLKTF